MAPPVPAPAAPPAPVITPEIQNLIDNPPPGYDVAALKAHFGIVDVAAHPQAPVAAQPPGMDPAPVVAAYAAQEAAAAAPAAPIADPRPTEAKAPKRKERADKGQPRTATAKKAALALIGSCAAGGLSIDSARQYLALAEEVAG